MPAARLPLRIISSRQASSIASTSKARFEHSESEAVFPKGYVVAGLHCGIKKDPDGLDLGILLSTQDASAAACFTRNAFQAAPVVVSKEVLGDRKGKARALVVNSGCANAVTGSLGLEHARAMSSSLAGKGVGDALVMSTGVIGQHLPIRRIMGGIETGQAIMSSSFAAWHALARAFMTTDTFPKLRTRRFMLGKDEYRIAGIAKGAGMIHPDMSPPHATLLALAATDVPIEPQSLQNALTYAVDRSFNSISVDGDMSTNDTMLAFANGAAGGETLSESATPQLYEAFRNELSSFSQELSSLIVRDGEGATKFIKVLVENAPTYAGAKTIASTVSTSSLVKTALYGQDANWGRILCAVGYSRPDFDIDTSKISVSFVPSDGSPPLKLLSNGEPQPVNEARASEILSLEDLEIQIDLGIGTESAAYYTCDLSHEYVSIKFATDHCCA